MGIGPGAGKECEVRFSGLAPGFVGVWQLNFKIPDDAGSGQQSLLVTVDGHETNKVIVHVSGS